MSANKIIIPYPLIYNLFQFCNIIQFPENQTVLNFEPAIERFHMNISLGSILRIRNKGFTVHDNFTKPSVTSIDSILIMVNDYIFDSPALLS